jgi:hypothetical protein
MKETLNIQTKVKIQNENAIPAGLLIEILRAVNHSYFYSELNDLRDLRKEFPEIPNIDFDNVETRIKNYHNSATLVQGINKGSIEFVTVGSGLLVWLLQQTLGETIREAWIEGNWYAKIKKFLLERVVDKPYKISKEIKIFLKRNLKAEAEILIDVNSEQQVVFIYITIFANENRIFSRTPDEILDNPEQEI